MGTFAGKARYGLTLMICACGVAATACGAVYPEMKTPVRALAPGEPAFDTPPPQNFYYFTFQGAQVPTKTRDGRQWVPNAYAKLVVDGKELLVTPVEPGTNRPTWPNQTRANYRILPEQEVVVEVWDDTPLADQPICRERVLRLQQLAEGGQNQIDCDGGARLWVRVEPARAVMGAGFYYELRGSDGVQITRVLPQSPADRAGLRPGQRVTAIQGTPVDQLDALAVRSRINANIRSGLKLVVADGGKSKEVTIAEGMIYPLAGDDQGLIAP